MLQQLLAVARLPSSAFDRHQAAAAKSREEIGLKCAAETMFMFILSVGSRNISLELITKGKLATVKGFEC